MAGYIKRIASWPQGFLRVLVLLCIAFSLPNPGYAQGAASALQAYANADYMLSFRLLNVELQRRQDPLLFYLLGTQYLRGLGTQTNYTFAEQAFQSAGSSYAPALLSLGLMREQGLGSPPNPAEAAQYYAAAVRFGNPAAAYRLGLLYRDGNGVAKDDAEAEKWLRFAADQGIVDAQYELGRLYSLNATDQATYQNGLVLLQRAQQAGHPVAALMLENLARYRR
jgi:TPR repeat protein